MISFEVKSDIRMLNLTKRQSYDHLIEFLDTMFYDRKDRIVIISNVLIRHHHVHQVSNHRLNLVFHMHLKSTINFMKKTTKQS